MPTGKNHIHHYFNAREVSKKNDEDKTVTSTYYKCLFCAKELVFSSVARLRQHLSGDATLAAGSGGWGACPSVPEAIADRFKKEIMDTIRSRAQLSLRTSTREHNDERASGSKHAVQPLLMGMPKLRA